MIAHQSPYNQTLMFSSNLYFSLTDEKLAEIEQNCANIDREIIIIGGSSNSNIIVTDENIDLDIDV
jgi:hypothetical protein